MTVSIATTGLRLYQSANVNEEAIREGFLVRIHEFDIIMDDIRRNPMNGSVQHYLLLGRRGSGKSTLLKRIQVEIDSDEQLQHTHIAINLAEEQANIYRLLDLLNEIIEELEYRGITVAKPEESEDNNRYCRDLFSAIHESINRSGKKVVLLLDNIDRIFENLRDDSHLLREMLLNFDDIKIIGGSTRMTEDFWAYDKPFYQFFRALELEPLTIDEIKTLLLYWSKKLDLPELAAFVETRPGQLQTVRLLTDGLPRTLQFFVNLLVNHTQDTGYEYMRQIMDAVTPQYQERLNSLPAAQRKIVMQMAFIWEAAGAKEIAAASQMNNSVVSAQLKQLTDKGLVEKLETGTKNHLYRLGERFFNLWLIFTQGSPREKRRARCLTVFMEHFYGEDGMRSLATRHLLSLSQHEFSPDKAALITKALAQSKYINSYTRDSLIEQTLLLDINEDLRKQIPEKISHIINKVKDYSTQGQWDKARKEVELIEQEDGIKEYLHGAINHSSGDLNEAKRFYLLSIDKGMVISMNSLGVLYFEDGKFDLAEKYYLLAINKDYVDSMFNLGLLYDKMEKIDLAEKYYLLAIGKRELKSLNNLGTLYCNMGKFDLAEKYYLLAIGKREVNSMFNLGTLYYNMRKFDLAEKYYLLAMENGDVESLNNLGTLYYNMGKFDLAEKYYLLAIGKRGGNSMFNLGTLYYNMGKFDLAEQYYLLAIGKGDISSIYNLGVLYSNMGKFDQAEKYYLLSIENGDNSSLNNLGLLYDKMEKIDLAEKYYLLAMENGDVESLNNLGTLYSNMGKFDLAEKYYLLADGKGDEYALFNLNLLYYSKGINRQKALVLISEMKVHANEGAFISTIEYKSKIINLFILVSAWSGNMREATRELYEVIKNRDYENLSFTLENLLYHYQVNLVSSLFNDPDFGDELKERFQPIYYAVGILVGKDANIALKIPPEIKETVDIILNNVKEKQEFYYPRRNISKR